MSELAQVLRHLGPIESTEALVDASTGDDAAVYSLSDGRALVVTVDFFAPLVDEPYDFGRIAAANALSDIYAMGARPLFGLNLLAFPRTLLDGGIVDEIIRGGSDTAREAGIPILGGHSVHDPEPKYGMVIVGDAVKKTVVTNARAHVGDQLLLTKPLGTGIVATALKAEEAPEDVVHAAVASMTLLNRGAAEAMVRAGIQSATDVSGYGLLGHLANLLLQSDVAAEIDAASVPVLAGVTQLIAEGHVPGGTRRNLKDVENYVDFGDADQVLRLILTDAQTSGGLLISAPQDRAARLLEELRKETPQAAAIGRVTAGAPGSVKVL